MHEFNNNWSQTGKVKRGFSNIIVQMTARDNSPTLNSHQIYACENLQLTTWIHKTLIAANTLESLIATFKY